MTDPATLLDEFVRDGWDSHPYDRMLELVKTDAANATRLVALAIRRSVRPATFLDAAISFVPESDLPQLAREAVDALGADPANGVAEDTIAYLSLQQVESLQPYLFPFFFDLKPNADAYYADWPWRGATDDDLREILDYMEVAESPEQRARAFRCVLESRRIERIPAALDRLREGDLQASQDDYLLEVGLAGSSRFLYAEQGFHVCLPIDYLDEVSRPAWVSPKNHPSWSLEPISARHRFGGSAEGGCGVCGGGLHNLISLSPAPRGIGVASREKLELATCLSCLGWSEEVLWFRHDADGRAESWNTRRAEPEFPAKPLKEITARLAPTPRRWQWQDWALSNSRENLHRIGGHPTWVQSAQYPSCPDCDGTMSLLVQLDSNLPTADGEEWLWGSGGVCYVFWCDDCAVSASLWQCT